MAATCLKWKHVIVHVTVIAVAVARLPADRIFRLAAHAAAKQFPNTSFLTRSCGRLGRNLLQADNRISRDAFSVADLKKNHPPPEKIREIYLLEKTTAFVVIRLEKRTKWVYIISRLNSLLFNFLLKIYITIMVVLFELNECDLGDSEPCI